MFAAVTTTATVVVAAEASTASQSHAGYDVYFPSPCGMAINGEDLEVGDELVEGGVGNGEGSGLEELGYGLILVVEGSQGKEDLDIL